MVLHINNCKNQFKPVSYGDTSFQVSKGGIQNLPDFLPKINKENDCIWSIDIVARWQNGTKSDF